MFFLWHFGRLNGTLALVIALLGFVILWQVVGRISDRIVDLTGIAEGQVQQSAALPSQQSPIVPRLGPIAEIGDPALARVLGANAAPRSISTCGARSAPTTACCTASSPTCARDGRVARRSPSVRWRWRCPRSASVAASPLMLVIACAIKAADGGAVFYRQPRVGRGGRRFVSWEFRSMIPESAARFGPREAASADERVTPVGRVLRTPAMDELPELWSIFPGDMSLVGPRALMPAEIEVADAREAVSNRDDSGATSSGIGSCRASRGSPRSTPIGTSHGATSSGTTAFTSAVAPSGSTCA